MPIRFACPDCGATFTVPDELAGKMRTCSRCKATVQVPNQPADPTEEDYRRSPPPIRVARRRQKAPDVSEDYDDAIDSNWEADHGYREPWYYRYCETGVKVLMGIAIAVFAIVLVVSLGLILLTAIGGIGQGIGPWPALVTAFFSALWLLPWLAWLLLTIFGLCFSFIFIDIGRSLRELVRRQDRWPEG